MKKLSTILILSLAVQFACKPKPTSENVVQNNEISEVLDTFDTLAFVENIQKYPSGLGRYALASCDSLKDDDLDYISPKELRLIRNEIFARYGYRFKDSELQTYFAKQNWYKPLFDDVDQFLTPLERANIKFIQEKEKTNPNISDEKQFQIFLEKLERSEMLERYLEEQEQNSWGSKMLLYKFFVSRKCVMSGYHFYVGQLPARKNYIYLIHAVDDTFVYSLAVYQFSKKGELLNRFFLGYSDREVPFVKEKSNNNYEIWSTYYPVSEECPNALMDTIRFPFHYDNNGQIIIKEK
jgi:hypothetical protein